MNVEPTPTWLVTQILPPCNSTNFRQRVSPSPVPSTEAQRQLARDNAWTIVGQLGDTATITCADIGSLKMPVLLVNGEKTTRDFLDILDATHKCLPSAERVVIPNAGHGMHRQNSAAFDAALVKFLLD